MTVPYLLYKTQPNQTKMSGGRLKINKRCFFSTIVKQWRASKHRTL